MRKLLRADFARLWRDKIFWLALTAMAAAGQFCFWARFSEYREGYSVALEGPFMVYVPVAAIVLSALCALFIGVDYSDGTIRNKLIAGHGRASVYLSNLVVCLADVAILCAAFMLTYLAPGIPTYGFFGCGLKPMLVCALLGAGALAAFAALYTLAAMLCQNRAYSAVACVLLSLALLMGGVAVKSRLEEPEYYDGYTVIMNGVTQTEEPEKNPNYISGKTRETFEFLLDFLPGGQAVQLAVREAAHPVRMALCDAFILLAATGAGVIVFKKKNLK